MFAPDDIKDIIITLIAGLFGGGLVFLVNFYKNKRIADLAAISQKDKHNIDSGRLALEFIQELRVQINQLNTRVAGLENDLFTQKESGIMKDVRIAELERITAEQDIEIKELRQTIADKDELIKQLTIRFETLENGKAAKTEPLPRTE